jgi:hypothetical protein
VELDYWLGYYKEGEGGDTEDSWTDAAKEVRFAGGI